MNKNPRRREEATTSLVDTYKKDTPGQGKRKTFLEFAGVSPAVMGSLDVSTIPSPSGAFGSKKSKEVKKKSRYDQHIETKPTMPLVGH
jgi:hypothetical protein